MCHFKLKEPSLATNANPRLLQLRKSAPEEEGHRSCLRLEEASTSTAKEMNQVSCRFYVISFVLPKLISLASKHYSVFENCFSPLPSPFPA